MDLDGSWDVIRQVMGVRISPVGKSTGLNTEVWERKTSQRTIGFLCSKYPMASGKRKKINHRGTHMGLSKVL